MAIQYLLGLSGADSRTTVSIATLQGVVVNSFSVGAINFFYAEEDEIAHNLAEVFVTAQLAGFPIRDCRQVCAGVAGLTGGMAVRELPGSLGPMLRGVMRRCGYTGDALLLGDDQVALAGALGGGKGAILIAGDASVCFGKNGFGRQHRTGGLGQLADDDGSAYAIGREVLRAVARASDGRGQPTRLTAEVYRQFGLAGGADLARLLRQNDLSAADICSVAGTMPRACQAADKVALELVDKVAFQLLALVQPVVDRLHLEESTLAVAGRILLQDAFVGVAVKKLLSARYPNLQCVPPRSDGVTGAVLLAKERLALRGFQ